MNDLLNLAVEAHGGLKRWSQLTTVKASVSITGKLWQLKAMHATPTVDYAVVLEGEIWLEVDDHQTVHVRRGDVVIQNGTRHGWRNKGSQSATMLFVLHGADQ
jgi:quercetin dioxygenase-like cupin family protein